MGFPRQEYWSGLPFPPPEHRLNPGIQPASPTPPNSAKGRFFNTEPAGKPLLRLWFHHDYVFFLSMCGFLVGTLELQYYICYLFVTFSGFRETTRGCFVAQSCLTLCNHLDYIAHQAPLFMGFSRQEYWSRLLFPSPTFEGCFPKDSK